MNPLLAQIPKWEALREAARTVREKAWAPYSKYHVGAAVLTDSGEIFTGCNVENASYGLTICAERVAIWNWVSQKRKTSQLEFLVLVTDTTDPIATPCGMCLQVLSEFLSPSFPIHLANLDGIKKVVTMKDLLPMTFKLDRN